MDLISMVRWLLTFDLQNGETHTAVHVSDAERYLLSLFSRLVYLFTSLNKQP